MRRPKQIRFALGLGLVVAAGGVGLHLREQQLAVAEQLDVGLTHRAEHLGTLAHVLPCTVPQPRTPERVRLIAHAAPDTDFADLAIRRCG